MAWHLVADHWPAFRRALLLLPTFVRVESSYVRARVALLNAELGRDVARFLAIARADTRRIDRIGSPWSDAVARLLNAAVASVEGRANDVRDMLAAAVSGFERADMKLYAAVARRRLGVIQGEYGRALVDGADAWMAAEGIKNPARIARLIAPGFSDSSER